MASKLKQPNKIIGQLLVILYLKAQGLTVLKEFIYYLVKWLNPVEFKYNLYEECFSDVVVTHSPRYLINMNLDKGETIFDKINFPYNKLRREDNPIKPIVNFYRDNLKEGQELWWIGDEDSDKSKNIIIRFWNSLNSKEQNYYRIMGMIFFLPYSI